MKKVIAIMILLVIVLTLFSPLRVVYADVVIDDTSTTVLSSDQLELGRRFATLSILENLIANGVDSFSFSNVSNVDDFIDNLWYEIDTGINNPDLDVEVINNVLDWENLNDVNKYLDDNANTFGMKLFNMGVNGIEKLSDFFSSQENYELKDTRRNIQPFNAFRYIANNSQDIIPNPDPDYISLLNRMNNNQEGGFYWKNINETNYSGYPYYRNSTILKYPVTNYTWYSSPSSPDTYSSSFAEYSFDAGYIQCSDIQTLYINEVNGQYICTMTNTSGSLSNILNDNGDFFSSMHPVYNSLNSFKAINGNIPTYMISPGKVASHTNNSLWYALNYYANRFRNINVYVNGDPWAIVGYVNGPTIDIDGIVKINNNSQPIQYEFPEDIYIDYNKLYEVILRAIQNGTPVSMDTITNNNTYIDSHDTTYSPTIYNYYNDDSSDEEDFIDTLLNTATVPNFNQTYLIPLTEPLNNGFKALYVSVSAIPEEILVIFGGLFVLLLFVAILNRMLE